MTTQTATFSNGEVTTRNIRNAEYAVAWRVYRDGRVIAGGWSSTDELAVKAIRKELARVTKFSPAGLTSEKTLAVNA